MHIIYPLVIKHGRWASQWEIENKRRIFMDILGLSTVMFDYERVNETIVKTQPAGINNKSGKGTTRCAIPNFNHQGRMKCR